MGLADGIFEYLRHRSFVEGADFLEAAEAMADRDHPGPAVRMYQQALDFFQNSAGGMTDSRMVANRDRCRKAAEARGEDVSIAFAPPIDTIQADPVRFMEWYYARQAETIGERLGGLIVAGEFAQAARMGDAAGGFLQYAGERSRLVGEYESAFFSGQALVKIGRYQDAVGRIERARGMLPSRGDVEPHTRAWCAYFLGVALFHTGSAAAGDVLAEAAERMGGSWQGPGEDTTAEERECLCLLARFHARKLKAPRDQAVAAANAILGISRPSGADAAAGYDEAAGRARHCIEADRLLAEGLACRDESRFAEAAGALDQACEEARAADAPAIVDLARAERTETSLRDPARLAEHARLVRQSLDGDRFAEADELYGKLRDRHRGNPDVAAVGEAIAEAKRDFADRQTKLADELIAQGETDQADKVLARAWETAQSVAHTPEGYDETLGRLSGAQAVQLGKEAKRLSQAGQYAPALALARQALGLANLPDDVAQKISEMLAKLSAGRDRAAMQCRQRLKTLMQQGQWEQAKGVLADAEGKGVDGQAHAERTRIEGYFEALGLLDEAGKHLRDSKTVAAGTAVDKVFQVTTVSSLIERAKTLKADISRLDTLIEETYVTQEKSLRYAGIGLLVGLVLGVVLWWNGGAGFLHSCWIVIMVCLTGWGTGMCVSKWSILAHNDNVHGLTVLCAGLLGGVLSFPLPWWAFLLTTGAAAAILRAVLGRMCPAQKPGRDPGSSR